MDTTTTAPPLRIALPKGRMLAGIEDALRAAGITMANGPRALRPRLSIARSDTKLLKPRAVVEMLHTGRRDVGFAGLDQVTELSAEVVELADLGRDRVRLVAAAPRALLVDGQLPDRPLVVASEYPSITREWIRDRGLDATCFRSFGATEALPPEDADLIVDVVQTGDTLAANGLEVCATLMTSTTRLYASTEAMADPDRARRLRALAGRLMQRAATAEGAAS